LGEKYKALDSWSAFIISSYENVEKDMGIRATKNRKIYNGMIKTYYYQFMGPKPPKNKNK
ncbi:MAG: class I SAM-dependent RNA methyltransferase, partial [Eubacterium sp.]